MAKENPFSPGTKCSPDAQGKTEVRNADWNQYDCPEELYRYPESAQGAVETDAEEGAAEMVDRDDPAGGEFDCDSPAFHTRNGGDRLP